MKKALLISAFLFVLLATSVLATERTRIYGYVDDINSDIKLILSYKAIGKQYDQTILKKPDSLGNWEYIVYADAGKIALTMNINGQEKVYSVTAGTEFQVDLLNPKAVVEEPAENITELINITQEAENTTATDASDDTNSTVTGQSIITDIKDIFSGKTLMTIGIIAGILIVLAGGFYGYKSWQKKSPKDIKVVSYKEKFSSENELDDAEKKLQAVKSEINAIKNKEERMKRVSSELESAEKELENLKKPGNSQEE